MTQESLESLVAKRDKIAQQIAAIKQEQSASALNEIQEKIQFFGFSPTQVFGVKVNARKPGTPVAPRYRNAETGATWSGRGKAPKWIAGKDREAFRI